MPGPISIDPEKRFVEETLSEVRRYVNQLNSENCDGLFVAYVNKVGHVSVLGFGLSGDLVLALNYYAKKSLEDYIEHGALHTTIPEPSEPPPTDG